MGTLITVLQIFVCLLMVALILLQPSKGGSFFTASNQGVFGSSGGTTFLFRATMWCAFFLAVTCLFLSWYRVHQAGESVVDGMPVSTAPAVPPPSTVPAPSAPASSPPVTVPPATTTPGTSTLPAAIPPKGKDAVPAPSAPAKVSPANKPTTTPAK